MQYTYTKYFLAFFWLTSITLSARAQKAESKPDNFPFVYATFSFQVPGGDLSKRFGVSNDIGGGAGYKTSNNWVLGAEASYIFGADLKENPLESMMNADFQITNMYGEPAQIDIRQAGYMLKASIGKIIPLIPHNKNSGLFIRGSLGLLQHKFYIESRGNNTPQILGAYTQGYDRLCNGLAVSEFIGWQNFSNEGAYHFLVGFEFTQAFTQNRRTWDFATNTRMDEQRLDLLYTFKMAWFIPFRQRQSSGYFYY